LVIGSLIAFVVLLAAIAFLMARLWQDDALVPALSNGPEVTAGIGEAVAVQGDGGPAVATASVAVGGGDTLAASAPVGAADPAPAPAVSAARPVSPQSAGAPRQPGPEADATPPQPTPVEVPAPSESDSSPPSPVVVADAGGPTKRPGAGVGQVPPRNAGADVPGVGRAEFEIAAGGEYRLVFSFAAEADVYREPGEQNLILRLRSEGSEDAALGLQLWSLPGDEWYGSAAHGLWASGAAMGAERFLAPLIDDEWHEVEVEFRASSEPDGYYVVSLDGHAIDARAPVGLIAPGSDGGVIEVGLFRDEPVEPNAGLHIAGAQLTGTTEPALP
jgi:hypothetical protein